MITIDTFRQLALSFQGTTEELHFEKISFRISKKIFATFDEKNNRACIKLPEVKQDVFSLFDKSVTFPVPNKFGKQGWTFMDLTKISEDMFLEALTISYHEAARKTSNNHKTNRIP
jgi:predicted DNA-binding protein (MmcQ/YjbR family)